MSTEQKVVIITGASQGIGAGLVRGYRDRNYRVIASSRSIKASADTDVLAVPGDISKPETAERIIREGLERFGRMPWRDLVTPAVSPRTTTRRTWASTSPASSI